MTLSPANVDGNVQFRRYLWDDADIFVLFRTQRWKPLLKEQSRYTSQDEAVGTWYKKGREKYFIHNKMRLPGLINQDELSSRF